MEYTVINVYKSGDESEILTTSNFQEAREAAEHERKIDQRDGNKDCTVEIRQYINEYDYNIIK